jgi:hypothetical protein
MKEAAIFGGLVEADADSSRWSPYYVARSLQVILANNQHKIIGYADRVFYFEISACIWNIPNGAVDHSRMTKWDRPGFQDALAQASSWFIHDKNTLALKFLALKLEVHRS